MIRRAALGAAALLAAALLTACNGDGKPGGEGPDPAEESKMQQLVDGAESAAEAAEKEAAQDD